MVLKPNLPLKTRLYFCETLPDPANLGNGTVLIYDRFLETLSPDFSKWIRRFKTRYPVIAGEELKQLRSFPAHFEALLELTSSLAPSDITFVSLGGGSVGDFTGFVASTFKRGVRLIHMPSTWLAAIDSVHGGKTALNAAGVKNSIGTFYPASEVYLIKPILSLQSQPRQEEALGELAKIALIDGGAWTLKISKKSALSANQKLWSLLPEAIRAKLKVVKRDPFERNGIRRVLNLGHTLGHVIESYHQMPHGKAVAQGLIFSLHWSAQRRLLTPKQAQQNLEWLENHFQITPELKPVPSSEFLALLMQDKKRESCASINFVFIKGRKGAAQGRLKCVVEKIKCAEFLSEAKRQGWVSK